MTFEERLAALGVDLSDLPYVYTEDQVNIAADKAEHWGFGITWRKYCDYILHLIDIIDRMETRIVNLTGERDYLLKYYGYDCKECVKYPDCSTLADSDDFTCVGSLLDDWAGVPEEWRADDD